VVDASSIGASKTDHLGDAVAALDFDLTDDKISALEQRYVPREPTYFD
jgi:aryl-alcohol dehydrogenase-like predicted oxidoreductase